MSTANSNPDCAGFYSAGHKVLCRNLGLTQHFCTYVYVASIELIAASHLSVQDQHPLTGTLFYIIVVMIPHYFHKQQYSLS